MARVTIPEPLRSMLKSHFHVELFWTHWHEDIQASLSSDPKMAADFREQFAELIVEGKMPPEQYAEITNDDYSDAADLNTWFRELWVEIYGDVPIPGDKP